MADATIRTTKTAFFSLYCFTEYTPRNTTYVTRLRNENSLRTRAPRDRKLPSLSPFAMCVHLLLPFYSHSHAHTHTRTCVTHTRRPLVLFAINFCPIISRTACPRPALRRRYPALPPPRKQFVRIHRSEFRKQRSFDLRKNLFTSLIA